MNPTLPAKGRASSAKGTDNTIPKIIRPPVAFMQLKRLLAFRLIGAFATAALLSLPLRSAETVALWTFDEPAGMYPSSIIMDHASGDAPLALGPGGSIVAGKFGNALSSHPQPEIKYPSGGVLFGLSQAPTPPGRTVAPLSWMNARFAALMTSGEKHLRKEFAYANATKTGLNLGAFDWTVEFWFKPDAAAGNGDGVVFEVGQGPRGENDHVTALVLKGDRSGFTLVNQPAGARVDIPSDAAALRDGGRWTHFAFVYDASARRLTHFVDGRPQGAPVSADIRALPEGDEAYFTLARDAKWERPLPGALDEMRFSRGDVYTAAFTPASLVSGGQIGEQARKPAVTEPLLFAGSAAPAEPLALGSRKYLMIDDALFPQHTEVTFLPTPPDRVQFLFEVQGSFRKHLTVIEGDDGLIRIYNPIGQDDKLGVRTSRDGVHFEIPKLPNGDAKNPNIATSFSAGTPGIFIDPLAPASERWKLVSGDEGHGIFLAASADGFTWKRSPTAALSSWSGSQSNMFYDDQRGQYVGYHRTDIGENVFNKTERRFVVTILDNLKTPWPFHPLSQAGYDRIARSIRVDLFRPWYLDNGPLTPGGIGLEYPFAFRPTDGFDPEATDIYVPKAVKYPWAPDAYLAFPCIYFHYEETKPQTRAVLAERDRARGSGPIETQLMTSRDGLDWKRYPRPVWHGVGLSDNGYDIHQTYMAQGMIRRGDEIWMYSYDTEEYHSGGRGKHVRRAVFRTVQRLDRFVAATAPYDSEAMLYSRALTFTGRQLVLNVDTAASGYLQVGLLRGDGRPIEGYGLDDCVYVNGNELSYPVEWLGKGTDLSAFAGQPVRLVIRMRGSRLFSLQFTE